MKCSPMNTGILASSLQVTPSLGVLHASVTSRISCHCESASDSLCCRLCILWTAMLVKSLNYPCATKSWRSYGGLKKKKQTLLHTFLEVFPWPGTSSSMFSGIFFFVVFFLLLLRKEVKKIIITSREPQRHPGVWRPLVCPAVAVQTDSGDLCPTFTFSKNTHPLKNRGMQGVFMSNWKEVNKSSLCVCVCERVRVCLSAPCRWVAEWLLQPNDSLC